MGSWTDPLPITENGTVVFGPTLYTPVNNPIPQGPNIKEKIYRGINAPYSPPPLGDGTPIGLLLAITLEP